MTLREKVICEVYTGVCFCIGDERNAVYEYMKSIMGRPICTHELANPSIQSELREKSKSDFVDILADSYIYKLP